MLSNRNVVLYVFLFMILVLGAAWNNVSAEPDPTSRVILRATFQPPTTSTPTPTVDADLESGTPTPEVAPVSRPSPLSSIELQVIPAHTLLWTQVEWLDGLGTWHRVDGWQGPIDDLQGDVGIKRWWFPSSLFGAGPFRWVVLDKQGGDIIAASEPFTMPTSEGKKVLVQLDLP